MARYTDIDALLSELPDDLPYKASVKRVLIQAPTADVVPKSEVETLQRKYELAVAEREANVKGFAEEIAKAKSEALNEAASKFAGHSDYHGDTILSLLACMAEGKEVKSAEPLDLDIKKSDWASVLFKKLEDMINRSVVRDEDGGAYITISLLHEVTWLKKEYVKDCTTCKRLVSCEPNPFGICDEYKEGKK